MNLIAKNKLMALGMILLADSLSAQVSYTNTPDATIPAGNPSGILEQIDVSGLTGSLLNIQVSLDVAGGYNGDLYATLTGPQGQKAILLNRPGLSSSDAFGDADTGFDITLDDSGSNPNIHDYGLSSYSTNGSGQVTGTFASDGRNIDPQSAPGDFDTALANINLSIFQGSDANGMWSLFIADIVAGGNDPTLNSFNISLTTDAVPEPSTLALAGLGGISTLLLRRRGIH